MAQRVLLNMVYTYFEVNVIFHSFLYPSLDTIMYCWKIAIRPSAYDMFSLEFYSKNVPYFLIIIMASLILYLNQPRNFKCKSSYYYMFDILYIMFSGLWSGKLFVPVILKYGNGKWDLAWNVIWENINTHQNLVILTV